MNLDLKVFNEVCQFGDGLIILRVHGVGLGMGSPNRLLNSSFMMLIANLPSNKHPWQCFCQHGVVSQSCEEI